MTSPGEVTQLTLRAPAKVNLFLELLGKRADGYHEIVTVMQALDLHDRLTLEKSEEGIDLEVYAKSEGTEPVWRSDAIPRGSENLAYRAAMLFIAKTSVTGGVRIHLEKCIPVGAGLGGGSSDAASVLKGLNLLYGCGLQTDQLERLAAGLGSDVAFFIRGGTARCTGRGEIVQPIEPRPRGFFYCLMIPELLVLTEHIYAHVTTAVLTGPRKDVILLERCLREKNVPDLRKVLFNRLEDLVYEQHPELHRIRQSVRALTATETVLSGSGSCMYSVHATLADAQAVKELLDGAALPIRILVTRTWVRDPWVRDPEGLQNRS